MNNIYRQLCNDHKHMQNLLDVFEHLLHELGKQDRDPATLSMILEALDYFSVYPDQWHHPVEDLVFEQLLSKPVEIRDVVARITAEHSAIAEATRTMNQLFYAVANDAAVERERLFSTAQNYISLQREHMKKENEILLPLVNQYLTDNDWNKVTATLANRQSGHFHQGVKQLYEAIYQDLAGQELAVAY
ncbi:hemerythrin domain-containing protein [Microbulbifer sp. CAU 1566]|uniref:hemerythrin domain-containing protein n=1 Tax=Microbulbifer sp. CAU 1566 TaxID=2933269 RepID=UPI002006D5E3|nr:hemerythrin domain-containing protein [Microbulbifer sp. CAU 1566]MCK7596297.1 hemerythrin domain-containing protein [Microbulbifer sp. CAU 1566]